MSTKCAENHFDIVFNNKSGKNIVFSCTKNIDSLKDMISKKYYHDNRFKYLKKEYIKKDTLLGSDLDFYLSKDKTFYTFYFLKAIQFDTLNSIYVFKKKYDSINIFKEKFHTGLEHTSIFIYYNNKIVFKSYVKY